jgi:hypothetical protein
VHVSSDERPKLDVKFRLYIYIYIYIFKLWDPKTNKVVISRDVVFDEKAMLQRT